MPDSIQIHINGKPSQVAPGTTVAVALALAGVTRFHRSVASEPRGPLCGMGVCFECRVTINGQSQCRSCLTLCEAGMEVQTDA